MIETLYEPFKRWSQRGSVYIISDTHFDDIDCKLMDKNWITPDEQIKRINSLVTKNDTLIILGDVGNPLYMRQIKAGYKVLLLGNHDKGKLNYSPYFDEIYEGPLFISDKILLSHEPIISKNWLNIHGHEHSGETRENHLNLAANVCGYMPVSLAKVIKSGILHSIDSIHRTTIDRATKKKKKSKF